MFGQNWENNIVGADDDGSVHEDRIAQSAWDDDEAFEDGSASSEYQHSSEWESEKPKFNPKHRMR